MSKYQAIQRIPVEGQTTLEAIRDSISKYSGAWDAVAWFTPADFNDTLEVSEQKLRKFEPQVRAMQQQGMKVHFNVGYVLGHGDHVQTDFSAVVPHMVGPAGEMGKISVCPRSDELKQRVSSVFARFAALKPDCMWIDDDFRIQHHVPVPLGCYCDKCIGDFNAQYGYDFDRERLNQALLVDHFPEENTLRLQWLRFTHQSMVDLLKCISDAVHAVDPDIIMGVMIIGSLENTPELPDYHDYVEVMKNRKGEAYFRPGAGYYDDRNPLEGVKKTYSMAVTNYYSVTAGGESFSEFVICPYAKRTKSNLITTWECALAIGLGGVDGLTFEAINVMLGEMNYYVKAIHDLRPFYQTLSDTVSGRKQLGFYPYFSPLQWAYGDTQEHLKGLINDLNPNLFLNLFALGVPITADPSGALGVILAGKNVKAMPNAELEQWLKKGIYADADAASLANIKMGRDVFGVEVMQKSYDAREVFLDDPLNGDYAGFDRGAFWCSYGEGCGDMKVTGGRALSYVKGAPEFAGTAVYETPEGGKVAVQSRAPWADDILSYPKGTQILNILDWLCGGMPVRVDTHCKMGQSLWQGEKDLLCFLFSMDFDPAEQVRLTLKTPAKAKRLCYDGTWQEIGEGTEIVVDRIDGFTCAPILLTPIAE